MDKIIIIIRHAKSEWGTGVPDIERPLMERGRRDARAIGPLLAPYSIDLAWVSAAQRTQETWALACETGASALDTDVRNSFYGTWVYSLVNEMTVLEESVSTLAIVNHQPLVGDLVDTLAEPSELTSQATEHFPTSGVAILTHRGDWGSIRPRTLVLESFWKVRGTNGSRRGSTSGS